MRTLWLQGCWVHLVSGMMLFPQSLMEVPSVRNTASILEKLKWSQTSLFMAVRPCSRMFMTRCIDLRMVLLAQVVRLGRSLSRCSAITVLTEKLLLALLTALRLRFDRLTVALIPTPLTPSYTTLLRIWPGCPRPSC